MDAYVQERRPAAAVVVSPYLLVRRTGEMQVNFLLHQECQLPQEVLEVAYALHLVVAVVLAQSPCARVKATILAGA